MNVLRSLASLGVVILLCAALAPRACGQAGASTASVAYEVRIDIPNESFIVTADLDNIAGDTVTFYFPIWGPGAYDIVNFGSFVSAFKATTDGKPLRVIRGDTNTFRIIGPHRKIHLAYTVKDIERVPNSLWFGLSDIDRDFVFANTPAVFGYPAGYKDVPYRVKYVAPKGWQTAIGLEPEGAKGAASGNFLARDYDELVDAPLVMGKLQTVSFSVNGVPHTIVVHSDEKISAEQMKELADTTRRVVEIVSRFFGDMPYSHYVFQIFLVHPTMDDVMFGALEHRNSSTYRMPLFGQSPAEMLKGVLVHEYWHAWSPKRIHVAELGPFDYQRPPRTKSLWFAEGMTEYYAKTLVTRNGMSAPDELIEFLDQMTKGTAGQMQRQPITELSLRIGESNPQEAIALYSKGPMLCLMLDAEIRMQTGNRKGLDDAVRAFNDQFGKTGKTFGDDDIIPFIERITGAKLQAFYSSLIAGRDSLPYAKYLPQLGFKLVTSTEEKVTFGASFDQVPDGWKITDVSPGGSAAGMGLRVGDIVTEVSAGTRGIKLAKIPPAAADQFAGVASLTSVSILRAGSAQDVPIKFVKANVMVTSVALDDNASQASREMRRSMFGF